MENGCNFLGYITDKINPFLEQYPEYTGRLSTLFLQMIAVVRMEGKNSAILSLNVLKEFKAKIEEKQKIAPNLIGHNLSMAVLSLCMMPESELDEVEKYFKEIKTKRPSLESFLKKELNSTDDSFRSRTCNFVSAIMGMTLNDEEIDEDFVLFIEAKSSEIQQAIQKYFDSIGETVKFPDDSKFLNYFDYKIGEKSGCANVTVFGDTLMITMQSESR
ncbi:MAG TPA: hypothetical protein VIK86_03290 [Candidatus Paceibacterota bacterium]